jgi:hypothetical protein
MFMTALHVTDSVKCLCHYSEELPIRHGGLRSAGLKMDRGSRVSRHVVLETRVALGSPASPLHLLLELAAATSGNLQSVTEMPWCREVTE